MKLGIIIIYIYRQKDPKEHDQLEHGKQEKVMIRLISLHNEA